MRRDFPVAGARAHRAGRTWSSRSRRTPERRIERRFGVPPERIAVCRPGVPSWITGRSPPGRPAAAATFSSWARWSPEERAGLLAAYRRLVERWPDAPRLVLAGQVTRGRGSLGRGGAGTRRSATASTSRAMSRTSGGLQLYAGAQCPRPSVVRRGLRPARPRGHGPRHPGCRLERRGAARSRGRRRSARRPRRRRRPCPTPWSACMLTPAWRPRLREAGIDRARQFSWTSPFGRCCGLRGRPGPDRLEPAAEARGARMRIGDRHA